MTIDEQLFHVNQQIEDLQKIKSVLELKKLESATSFKDKFFVWLAIKDKNSYQDSILDETEFPLLTKFLEDWDFNKYEKVNVINHLRSYIEDLRNSESEEVKQKLQDNPNYFAILQEIMDGNIKSFKNDW